MGKVRYKEPSENFLESVSKNTGGTLRASLGREQAVGEYYFIALTNIIPYKKQARKKFPSEEIEQLAQTIREHGITSPLHVIPSEAEQGKFEVISGERRLRAAHIVGLTKVPCIILKEKEENNAEEIALIENIQRKDLHPVELADSLESIMKNYKWGDISALAAKIGKPQSAISLHLSYSKFPLEIKDYLLEKDIRSRDILRKLVACNNLEEMKSTLGMQDNKLSPPVKSILRISFQNNELKVQDRPIKKLNRKSLLDLKLKLESIIQDIERIAKTVNED